MGHVVSYRKLRDHVLHTFLGIIWYCMKDNGENHFQFVHHNVSINDMNEGEMEYVKFEKVGLKNYVSLSYSNTLQRIHQ